MAVILVIEDDPRIREAVTRALTAKGHSVEAIGNGLDGVRQILALQPDVVILDLGLPDIGGADVLRMVRAVSAVPVIVATARDDEESMIELLDAGADDYVVKPYSGEQLEARVRAVLRRAGAADAVEPELTIGELTIDPATRMASLAGNVLDLSRKEFDLLFAIAERRGNVVTRRELLAEVWQLPYGGADKTLDVHLSWLRKKLGETANEPRYLHTVRGVGVRLLAPDQAPL
jgi:DNA-binding response OmpR family regulator